MTSKVEISAHCADSKQVVIETDTNGVIDTYHLNNGETKTLYVCDDRKVTAYEAVKEE